MSERVPEPLLAEARAAAANALREDKVPNPARSCGCDGCADELAAAAVAAVADLLYRAGREAVDLPPEPQP